MTHSRVLACRVLSSSLVGMLPLLATPFVLPARRAFFSGKSSSKSRLQWPAPRSYKHHKHPMRLLKAPLVVPPQPFSSKQSGQAGLSPKHSPEHSPEHSSKCESKFLCERAVVRVPARSSDPRSEPLPSLSDSSALSPNQWLTQRALPGRRCAAVRGAKVYAWQKPSNLLLGAGGETPGALVRHRQRPWGALALVAAFCVQPFVMQPLLAADHTFYHASVDGERLSERANPSEASPTEVFSRDEVCEPSGSSCVASGLKPGFNDSSFDYRRGFQPEQRRFCYQGEAQGVCEVIEKAAAAMQAQYRAGGHDTIDLRSCQVVATSDASALQEVHADYVLRDDYHGYFEVKRRILPCETMP